MSYNSPGPSGDWVLCEVVKNGRHLCTGEFADANDEELQHIYGELRLLQVAGCPPDSQKGQPTIQKVGKCKKHGRKSISVHVLKAKPSPWRLYFHVLSHQARQIEFLYAVSKKTDKRDPKDLEKCCRIVDDIFAGRTSRAIISIPGR